MEQATGEQIRRRREALGLSVKKLAELAGVDRGRLAKFEAGEVTVRGATIGAIEAALAKFDEETSGPYDENPSESGLVTFRVSGNFGVDVVVQGPVADVNELEQAVERLIRKMRDTE